MRGKSEIARWLVRASIAVTFFCSLVVAAGADAQPASIAPDWNGTYFYSQTDTRSPVAFTLQLRVDGSEISGRISEPATFGDGSSQRLYANITGTISGTSISFTKTYDGTASVNHSVQYTGTLSADGLKMSGTWTIRTLSGTFSAVGKR